MTQIRADRFEVGDRVTFIDLDDYTSDLVLQNHWRVHGRGPYAVEETEDVPDWQLENSNLRTLHTQYVTINGERYSGYWLKPSRPS